VEVSWNSLGPRAGPVFEALRARILSGEYTPSQRLPSHVELARFYGVAALTLRQALAALEEDGLVSSEQGRGTFVRNPAYRQPSAGRMIAASPAPIISLDLDGNVTSWNPATELLLGWAADEVIGHRLPSVPEELLPEFKNILRRVATGETLNNVERRRQRKDGNWLDVSIDIAPAPDASGTISGMVAVYTDITARKRAESALTEAEQRFRATFDRAAVGIAHTGLDGSWLLVNQQLCDLYGRTREELMQLRFQDITHPDDLQADLEQFERLLSGGIDSYSLRKRYMGKDGGLIWANLTVSMVREADGNPQYVIAIVEDVSAQVQAQEQLAHRALHDPLTELPNRTLLSDRLQQAILSAQRQLRPVSLLLMDLDRFKEVNDTYGHQFGDQILQQLGSRLAPLLRRSDTIGRLGGDEFAIVLPGTDASGAKQTARRLLRSLDEPFLLGGNSFDIGGSIGIAMYPRHGSDAGTLLRHADVAMYVAKRLGGGYVLYSPDKDQYSHDRLALVSELKHAIERDELRLHYQPKVNLNTGEIEGVEALVRWLHPERGLQHPEQFIPLAEHTGLIRPLTLWVLKRTLEQCKAWEETGLQLSVAVNLSPRSLLDMEVIESVVSALSESGVHPQRLSVELTESAVMADPARAEEALWRLHDTGVKIAIDDFGTGYSSLAHLKRLPVDQIKIDRSFVQEMLTSDSDSSIVRAIVGLGRDLGIEVVAEGAENKEICDALEALGCNVVQGFHFTSPLLPEDLTQWMLGREQKVA
jgi:diguanylate cyclase (GGDEF)-like protein/PAS domain S-box-containing protein